MKSSGEKWIGNGNLKKIMNHSLSQKILPQKSSHQSSYFYPSLTEKTNMTPRVADDAIKINHN